MIDIGYYIGMVCLMLAAAGLIVMIMSVFLRSDIVIVVGFSICMMGMAGALLGVIISAAGELISEFNTGAIVLLLS